MPKDPAAAAAFLDALAAGWSVTAAAQQADFDRRTLYRRRARDKKFAEAWDHAVETATDRLEDELYRRATQGATKTTAKQGAVVTVTQASDRLLIALLAARRPERFRPLRGKTQPEAHHGASSADDDSARKRLHRKLDRLARALGAAEGNPAGE